MADYIYLLENRLSPAQQRALKHVREVALGHGMNVFLTGGAVRDLTSGSPVRDLDISVQGNASKLKKDIEKAGGTLAGEQTAPQTLFFKFPGGVRVEISGTRTETYPVPGKPVYLPSDLKQDLYRRDFTANAMALSLNDGSYGLLIDPMNGVADIESRLLRLASNYGFIEAPSRLIRAARLSARLGWQMDEKTQVRYQTAKDENYMAALTAYAKGYELEEIVHEEDPLKVLKALEAEGWMKALFPAWGAAKANLAGLQSLHDSMMKLQMQGVSPDASAANFILLTAKMPPRDIAALKGLFPRQGFVGEIERLDEEAREFAKLLMSRDAAAPSSTWKLLTSHPAEAVLWLAHTSKSAAVQAKFHNFFTVWPEARQKYPYLLMQEMRITSDLPRYEELLQALFFEMMDSKLQTPEEMKAYLEPFSPPAPPPPVHLRRPRAMKKQEGKGSRKKQSGKSSAEAAKPEVVVAAFPAQPPIELPGREVKIPETPTVAAKSATGPASVEKRAKTRPASVVTAMAAQQGGSGAAPTGKKGATKSATQAAATRESMPPASITARAVALPPGKAGTPAKAGGNEKTKAKRGKVRSASPPATSSKSLAHKSASGAALPVRPTRKADPSVKSKPVVPAKTSHSSSKTAVHKTASTAKKQAAAAKSSPGASPTRKTPIAATPPKKGSTVSRAGSKTIAPRETVKKKAVEAVVSPAAVAKKAGNDSRGGKKQPPHASRNAAKTVPRKRT